MTEAIVQSQLVISRGGPLIFLLTVSAMGFLLVIFSSFFRRVIAGASPQQLVASGCYEWVPARGCLYVIYGGLAIAEMGSLIGLIASLIRLVSQFNNERVPDWPAAWFWLAAAAAAYLLGRIVRLTYAKQLIQLNNVHLPTVQVDVQSVVPMRSTGDILRIGTQQFPNSASSSFRMGLVVRGCLWCLYGAAFIYQMIVSSEIDRHQSLNAPAWLLSSVAAARAHYISGVEAIRNWPVSEALWLALAYHAAAALVILLSSNRHYLLIRFPVALLLAIVLSSAAWISATGIGPIGDYNMSIPYLTGSALLVLNWWRWHRDLMLAARYKRRRKLLQSIDSELDSSTQGFLAHVQSDAACRLPELDCEALSERITRGARNLEEGGFFVTRFFGRYMRVAKVATERCTTASMRFLSVGRRTELGSYWPTTEPLRDPAVPIWNRDIFPPDAPQGFTDLHQREALNRRWNPIYYCPPTELQTETYYETEYYSEWDAGSNQYVTRSRQVAKTRQVTVTCSRCNGAGRLEHQRYLVTSWVTTRPTVVDPPMEMPELVERGEEQIYYQLPMIEEGRRLSEQPVHVQASTDLISAMKSVGERMAQLEPQFSAQVLQLTGHAMVYRCDFIIGGMHTINVRFNFLASRSGWFFGSRPEFHFPKLPIGWATVGSSVFLPPLAVAVWSTVILTMIRYMHVVSTWPLPAFIRGAIG